MYPDQMTHPQSPHSGNAPRYLNAIYGAGQPRLYRAKREIFGHSLQKIVFYTQTSGKAIHGLE